MVNGIFFLFSKILWKSFPVNKLSSTGPFYRTVRYRDVKYSTENIINHVVKIM